MAWTVPTTRSAGALITAAIWNTDIVDNLKDAFTSGRIFVSSTLLSVGAATRAQSYFQIAGSFAPADAGVYVAGWDFRPSITGTPGDNLYGAIWEPTLVEAASGVHALIAGTRFNIPTVTGAAATVTDAATVFIEGVSTVTVTGANHALWVLAGLSRFGGNVFVDETTNANMTIGVTVNQGTADNELFAGKSSDVAHGVTTVAETDTYVTVSKADAASGGALITGFSEDATGGVNLRGIAGTADTTKLTSSGAAIVLNGQAANGTGVQSLGVNGNVAVIRENNTTRFIFDVEGSAHADVEWIAFDAADDIRALNSFDAIMGAHRDRSLINLAWTDALIDDRDFLVRERIVNFYDDGPRAMVNFTRLAMLHTGAIRQTGRRLDRVTRCLLATGVVTQAQLDAA